MQNGNDFGGIESWQHGPVYIFNNLSFDARGQREGERIHNKGNPGFGHAYYLDGGFKHYVFNNIAWGLSNDPTSPLVNCSAFQEIYSHQNVFLNNTAYNFTVGSRRQAPHAGTEQVPGQCLAEHERARLPSRRPGQDPGGRQRRTRRAAEGPFRLRNQRLCRQRLLRHRPAGCLRGLRPLAPDAG